MVAFEVETEIVVYAKITIRVEASDKEHAVDAAAELLMEGAPGWKASVIATPPKGVAATVGKTVRVEQAAGGEKVRKLKAVA